MKTLFNQFDLNGRITSIKPYGNGHINKTFLVKTTKDAYIFQFVNSKVFPNVAMLMNNIFFVTEHIRSKGHPSLEIIKTKDGRLYLQVADEFLRGYRFIANSICYEALPSLEMVTEAAKGFGQFHCDLADIDVSKIGDVIPDFHNTPLRFKDFQSAVTRNRKKRLSLCEDEVDFLMSREKDYSLIMDALKKGEINKSVTHNDPKINNVVFDKDSGQVSCVLDLDTVMTGSFLFDFGDALRSLFTGDNEDSIDTSELKVNMDIYKAYLKGYYPMMKDTMTEKEKELLPYSILIITEELAMRFLGDFIEGDVYFGVQYPMHNLTRAKTQIALAKDILEHFDELAEATKEITK